jgi:hypothetical protein
MNDWLYAAKVYFASFAADFQASARVLPINATHAMMPIESVYPGDRNYVIGICVVWRSWCDKVLQQQSWYVVKRKKGDVIMFVYLTLTSSSAIHLLQQSSLSLKVCTESCDNSCTMRNSSRGLTTVFTSISKKEQM